MKTGLLLFLCSFFSYSICAQSVGIGNLTPDSSAILDLTNAQQKGLLIPSMTTIQKNSMATPANGLMIYQTDSAAGFYFFDSMRWRRIGEGGNAWIETDSTVYTNKHVGIGISKPSAPLHSKGNMNIEGYFVKGKQAGVIPSYNMPLTLMTYTDSSGVLYDDGGPNGNYTDLRNLRININPSGEQNTIIQVDSLDLLPGDTLIITGLGDSVKLSAMMRLEKRFYGLVIIKFKSNLNGNAAGFKLKWFGTWLPANAPSVVVLAPSGLIYNDSSKSCAVGYLRFADRIGEGSFSTGLSNASGDFSIAMGSGVATGDRCTAIGGGHAEGYYSTSLGVSHVTGLYATGLGFGDASGYNSVAMGLGEALASYSIACGTSEASGSYSIAGGTGSYSTGPVSLAFGNDVEANGGSSVALGHEVEANGFGCTALGIFNDPISGIQQEEEDMTSTTPLFIVGNGDADNLRSNALLVRKDGHVGIGNNSPRVKLHISNGSEASYDDEDGYLVLGSVNDPNIVMDNNEIMARDNGVLSDLYIQRSGGRVLIGAGTPNHLFDVGGSAGKPGGGDWSMYSDRRLKQNIQAYAPGLAELIKINPVRYQYNNLSGYDTTQQYVGLIAQELQQISPDMVKSTEQVMEDGSSGYLEVDGTALTYMLINAVKELKLEVETLKAQCEELKRNFQQQNVINAEVITH